MIEVTNETREHVRKLIRGTHYALIDAEAKLREAQRVRAWAAGQYESAQAVAASLGVVDE